MARTVKKKKELTIEEKLEQALVPVEEQPYQVPENWCWVSASNLALVISKGTTPRGGKAGYVDDGIRFLRVENFCEDGTLSHEGIMHISEEMHTGFLKRSILQEGDILVSIAGTLGKTAVVRSVDLPMNTNQAVSFIRPKDKIVNSIFIKFAFDTPVIQNHLLSQTKVTSIPNLTLEIIGKCPVPLPPLQEQRRIVDRIESLFAKLDEAKEKAQAVVDGFEDRKAAILHKAFTGELTKGWRKKKDISSNSWKQVTVKDACRDVKVGIVIKPSQYYTDENNGTAAFRSANVREFHIDDFDWVYLNELGMNTNQRSVVHTGDVLVVRSGNPGTACVVEERFDGYNAIDILIAVPDKDVITPDYLCAFTNSPMGRQLVAENKRGMALAHFNVSGYSKLQLPLPSVEEQKEIVSSLFTLLEKEQKAKEVAEQVISQIDTMKKSILARAFRGELGTNNPTDESAVELLKKIL